MTAPQPAGNAEPRPADLLLIGRVIADPDTVIEHGAVAVLDGRIAAVGPEQAVRAAWRSDRVRGGSDRTIMPGLVDGHTHAAQSIVRSLIAGEAPMIQRLYIPGELAMTPEHVTAATELLVAQLVRSGVTTLTETTATVEHEQLIEAALEATGVRATVARGGGDQPYAHVSTYGQVRGRSSAGPADAAARAADLARTAALLDRRPPDGDGLLRGAVLASHLTGFSEQYFRQSHELATERGAMYHVHVDRDRDEIDFVLSVYGERPIEVLARWGVLDARTVAIHAILASEREIALLGETGAAVAHSPVECLNILNGVPPVQRMRAAGVRVSLGSDNAINDGWAVMRAAYQLHTALYGIPAADAEHLPVRDVLRMATAEGADALGWGDRVGRIEVGLDADLVVLDAAAVHAVPVQDAVVDLVKYGSRAEVRDVYVRGRALLLDGEHTTIDVERLRARVAEAGAVAADTITPRRYRPLRG